MEGIQRQLEKFVKEIEDKEKGIELELEMEKDNNIVFLDMRIRKKEGKIYTEWYQKVVRPGTIAMLGVMWITRRRETS